MFATKEKKRIIVFDHNNMKLLNTKTFLNRIRLGAVVFNSLTNAKT